MRAASEKILRVGSKVSSTTMTAEKAVRYASSRCPFLHHNPGVVSATSTTSATSVLQPTAVRTIAKQCPVMHSVKTPGTDNIMRSFCSAARADYKGDNRFLNKILDLLIVFFQLCMEAKP